MNRESIDTWLERCILALVFGALVFGVLAFGAVRASDYLVVSWLIIAATALWIARIWIAPKFRFLLPPLCWAALPFVAYAIWRYRTADIEFVARIELLQIILAALLFLVIVNNLYSQESMRILSFGLVSLAMICAMYGIYQWLRTSDSVWGFVRPAAYRGRASGPFISPNHLAGSLEMILPLGAALVLSGRMKPLARIGVGYAALITLAGIACTQSRAGWISAAAGVVALTVAFLRTRKQAWGALAILLITSGAGYWFYERTVAPRFEQTQFSGQDRDIRLRIWDVAWRLSKDNRLWGIGADHFDSRYRQLREAHDRTQGRPGRVHNDYLNTLVDYGVVGLVLALLPIAAAAWSVFRCWPHLQRSNGKFLQKKSNRAALVLGSAAGLIALLVHSFLDFNMHIPANALVAVTLLALIASHMRFAAERYWITARWPVALAGTAVLAMSLVYLVPQTVTRSREVANLRRAEQLPDGSAKKIAFLKQAAALQPKNFETAFALGEQLRALAFTGGSEYAAQTAEALQWFDRAIALNRWDPNSVIRRGMCLDWLGKHDEAAPCFRRGLELDPNHWYPRAMMGWHSFQVENYQEARNWMVKSLAVNWTHNTLARTYFELSEKLLAEQKAKSARPKADQ